MALDPNIALAVRVAPFETRIQSPVDRYARMLSLRQLMQEGETSQLKRQQLEQSIADEATLRGLYAEGTPPTETQLYSKLGSRAAPIIKSQREAKTAALDTDIKQTTLNLERVKGVGQIVGATTDDASLQQNVALAVKNFGLDPQEGQRLIQQGFGHPATQAALKNLGEQTMTAIQRHEKALKDKQDARAQAGETRAEALAVPTLTAAQIKAEQAQAEQDAGMLAAAASRSQEEFQTKLAALPPDRAARFHGATTPLDIYKRGQTSAQRVASEQAAATAAATERYRQDQLGISRGQLGVAQEGLGLRREDLELRRQTQTGKPSTGEEKKALAFHLRAQQAEDTLTTLEDHMNKMGLFGQTWQKFGPEFAQSEENKALFQAQRAFTEARLRKESGAAIPPHEFENDKRTYFPQPGDSPERLKQKALGRAAVIRGLAVGAGRAHTEYYGVPPPTAKDPIETGGEKKTGDTVQMRAPNGQVQTVRRDQVEHYKSQGAEVVSQ